jgi:hypothetical protein
MNDSTSAAIKLCAGALALALALPALAATTALPSLQEHHDHGIAWVSGGIGSDESHALKAQAAHYPLSLVFSAGKNDEYLADIHVLVKDKAGRKLLDTVSSGPLMLVRLPAGDYAVSAVHGTRTLEENAKVAAHGDTQLSFHWPNA